MKTLRACVIGAGAGGLAAAIDLAAAGVKTTLLESHATPGGKMRQVAVSGPGNNAAQPTLIDAGPTVFTMPWVFESLFARGGKAFFDTLPAVPADILARHAWTGGGLLDLHADVRESAKAIEAFAGPNEARRFDAFCARARSNFETLNHSFMQAQQPSMLELTRRVGLIGLPGLLRTHPQRSMWSALGDYFHDPRLRQLFGRYATYVGSSPLEAPATLMLIAHVEQQGVWLLPGGMRSLASAMTELGRELGVDYRFNAPVAAIDTDPLGHVNGVRLEDETLPADLVIFAGDHAALAEGRLGETVRQAVPPVAPHRRGLSAVTWCVRGETHGFPLHYHNVFFAEDYPREFQTLFKHRSQPRQPTVYVCAQDRLGDAKPSGGERLLILVNAPADGDQDRWSETQQAEVWQAAVEVMGRCGLSISVQTDASITTTPAHFASLFPGSGGSLYGRASHGMMASFNRPGARSRVPGLYLAGGTVHPGPGVPMATLSGRLAAEAALSDAGIGR
ncbi:MAG: phytoene desaturase family protein [Halieaceae bacterium]|jgi:1-hydroxycarotenoid 3,4-desaturase|nr:phytoene desaturase family protein [Halieaceae bacterium]